MEAKRTGTEQGGKQKQRATLQTVHGKLLSKTDYAGETLLHERLFTNPTMVNVDFFKVFTPANAATGTAITGAEEFDPFHVLSTASTAGFARYLAINELTLFVARTLASGTQNGVSTYEHPDGYRRREHNRLDRRQPV